MTPSAPSEALTTLLQSLAQPKKPQPKITPTHISLLARSLLSSAPKSDRSLAYICLTKIVEDASSHGTEREQYLATTFRPCIEPFMDDSQGNVVRYVPPTALLTALFPLAPGVASGLLLAPLSKEEEAPDALAVLLEMAELESPLQLALAELFVAATGTKPGRELVQARAMEWLEGASRVQGDGRLAGVCCAALAKLRNSESEKDDPSALCETMITSLSRSLDSPPTVLAIVEGLSVLSLRPSTKHYLSSRPDFLSMLFGLLPSPARGGSLPTPGSTAFDPATYEPVDTSLCCGISTILVNLTARRPLLSAEDEQMAKLRAMAEQGSKGPGTEPDPLDQAPAVLQRVERLYKAGVVSALRGLARAESVLVRQMVGRLCLNLLEDKERRMAFIRDGGYKVLSEITRKLMEAYDGKPEPSTISVPIPTADIDILPTLQANAKLIITTPPNLLFPPPHLTTSLNALTPLYTLLTHPSSSLLQTFEALMGLTNLTSISPDIADRIVGASISPKGADGMWRSAPGEGIRIVQKVEEMMMEDNELVRRAATELVCNLSGCERGFAYFSGEGEGGVRARQRLTILLVLTDAEDLPMRLAAGGALAVITESTVACAAILANEGSSRSVWKRLSGLLEPDEVEEGGERIAVISTKAPEEGVLLRAGCILLNLLVYVKGLGGEEKGKEVKRLRGDGVEAALKGVLGMQVGLEVKGPVVECLKMLSGL